MSVAPRKVPGTLEALCIKVSSVRWQMWVSGEGALLSAVGNRKLGLSWLKSGNLCPPEVLLVHKFITRSPGVGSPPICLFSGSTMSPKMQAPHIAILGIASLARRAVLLMAIGRLSKIQASQADMKMSREEGALLGWEKPSQKSSGWLPSHLFSQNSHGQGGLTMNGWD